MRLTVIALLTTLALAACGEAPAPPGKGKAARPHLVETVVAARDEVAVSRVRTGTLQARRQVEVYNQEEGRITELNGFEGDSVAAGQVLVRLDDALLRAQLERAVATRRKTEQDLKRIRDLHKKKLTTEEALYSSETELAVAQADEAMLRTRLGYTTIEAPISGVVSARLSEPGNIAERYTHLLTVADLSSLITEVSLSELMLHQLRIGETVQVRIDALGDVQHAGRISRIHPSLDPVTRRGIVEIELSPVPDGARPGQLCRVRFDTFSGKRLLLPFRALRRDRAGEFVYTVDAEGIARHTPVRSGLRVDEQVEIVEGLEESQQVVVKGFLDLEDGKAVKVIGAKPGGDAAPERRDGA